MAEKNNKVIEIDSNDEDEPRKPDISRAETINLCEKFMEACLQHGGSSSDLLLRLTQVEASVDLERLGLRYLKGVFKCTECQGLP